MEDPSASRDDIRVRDRRTNGLVEYALLVALVTIVAVASIDSLGTTVRSRLNAVTAAI